MTASIKFAKTDKEIESCYPVLAQLHEDLVQDSFVADVRRLEQDGYKHVYLAHEHDVCAVAGFHCGESFA